MFIAILTLLIIKDTQGTYWINYDIPYSNIDTTFDDDPGEYLSALIRDREQEVHSPFINGDKYVSGGDRHHLSPKDEILNRPKVITYEELSSYCNPPNPCPLGFEADDCDISPMSTFTSEYSQLYQSEQNCQCDNAHEKCSANRIFNFNESPNRSTHSIVKRLRRIRRVRSFLFF
ncbi:unnamed protein product [Rotaria sp. Silwood2]|nr:unnamed protein product [Rotaria sp. Silwood2]CAF4062168.1 unnamed protein product [Rotaria sp. Silwood2]